MVLCLLLYFCRTRKKGFHLFLLPKKFVRFSDDETRRRRLSYLVRPRCVQFVCRHHEMSAKVSNYFYAVAIHLTCKTTMTCNSVNQYKNTLKSKLLSIILILYIIMQVSILRPIIIISRYLRITQHIFFICRNPIVNK